MSLYISLFLSFLFLIPTHHWKLRNYQTVRLAFPERSNCETVTTIGNDGLKQKSVMIKIDLVWNYKRKKNDATISSDNSKRMYSGIFGFKHNY